MCQCWIHLYFCRIKFNYTTVINLTKQLQHYDVEVIHSPPLFVLLDYCNISQMMTPNSKLIMLEVFIIRNSSNVVVQIYGDISLMCNSLLV